MPITGADVLRYKAQHAPKKTPAQQAAEALTPRAAPDVDADVLRAIGLKPQSRTAVPIHENPPHAPTAPRPPNSPPSPIPPRPRATGLATCQECGQTWRTEPVGGTFTTAPPKFCPACGTPTLQHAADSFGGLTAQCFTSLQVQRMLAQLLYEQWAGNQHAEQQKHPRFVDYLKEQLSV